MNILVVYDSMYGNTEKIAQAIGSAIGADVRAVKEVTSDQLVAVDALVVGSPTQAFQPLKSVKNWVKNLPAGTLKGVRIAAFDTRADVAQIGNRLLTLLTRLFGYAAEPLSAWLEKKGGSIIVAPEGFIVEGKEGPLRTGEIERATNWAKQISG